METEMQIIIVGCGKVGSTIAEQLSAEGHDITIVDTDESVVQALATRLDIMGVTGNGATHSILIDPRGDIRDTFTNLTAVVQCQSDAFIKALANGLEDFATSKFYHGWQKALNDATAAAQSYVSAYSQMLAVKRFHTLLQQNNDAKALVYGNSSAVRLGNFCSSDYIFVNRGVNGIEGTLSTAVGMAATNKDKRVFCVIGDLSLFYDQNALWNSNLGDNLSILLLSRMKLLIKFFFLGILFVRNLLRRTSLKMLFVLTKCVTCLATLVLTKGTVYLSWELGWGCHRFRFMRVS